MDKSIAWIKLNLGSSLPQHKQGVSRK